MLAMWRRWNRAYQGLLWDLDGLFTRWWHRNRIRIRGKCEACGDCCRRLVLWRNGQVVREQHDFDRLVEDDPFTYSRFEPFDTNASGDLVFRCSKLGEDNRCTVYSDRPVICRRYPEPRMFLHGARLPDACTYQVTVLVRDIR